MFGNNGSVTLKSSAICACVSQTVSSSKRTSNLTASSGWYSMISPCFSIICFAFIILLQMYEKKRYKVCFFRKYYLKNLFPFYFNKTETFCCLVVHSWGIK